jgi:aryl-alcohol dehydrogenase-like predicted oxidoreductase
MMSAAGASATVISSCGDASNNGQGLTGAEFNKSESGQEALADVVQAAKPDFLQINYSVTQRGAEKRVLPLARDLGVAVLTNRNFNDGALFEQVKGKELPGWAADSGITSWAQMFLKFALSHEAVTAVIPATGKPERQSDNLRAGFGPLLTAAQRTEVIDLVG